MEQISNRDREILRSLAKTKLEYVNSLRNEEILKQWNALGEGRRESPTVRLLFSNFSRDVVEARLANTRGVRYDFARMKMIDKDFYLEEFNHECILSNLGQLQAHLRLVRGGFPNL